MNRSLRNVSLFLLLTCSLLAGGCCLMDRHHHGPGKQACATMKPACQPCPNCPCKPAAAPAEAPAEAPAPAPDK